nr:hypothetical protein [uncultured Allomuricauda sp.]
MKILGTDKVLTFPFLRGFVWMIGVSSILGCETEESLEAIFENSTDSKVKIHFTSSLILSDFPSNTEVLNLESMAKVDYYRIGTDNLGGGVIGNYSLIEFDSIYITTTTNEVLKIFKPDTPGKNIYNIDQYWTVRETGKNHFEYTYTITDEDIGN